VVGDPSRPSSPPGAEGAPGTTSVRRVLLGELLVESKVITAEQLGEVLGSPRETGKKLGQVLLERGWITEAQLTQTLSLQLSVPWVSLYHIDFSRQLLNRLAREIAEKYCLIPIFVRHVKGQGETLYVAMDDPTNENALVEVSRLAGLPARPMIASASDIRSAIRVYYGEPSSGAPQVIDVPAPPTRLDPPTTMREGKGARIDVAPPTPPVPTTPDPPRSYPPPAPPARRSSPSMPPPVIEEAPPPTARSYPPPAVAAAVAEVTPEKPRESQPEPARRRPRMLNLTLLDGTTITLPQKKKNDAKPGENLTARDFVSALRATAHGADASEILGDQVKWEPVVAALLSILLRKGLIADWEFVEELRKI
jgi:type IV pilus assembly protein PilB